MDLPQLSGTTTKEFTIGGHKLTFRKARLKDFETHSVLQAKGMPGAEISVYMAAQLMYGYKQKFKKRLEWLKSLELSLDEANAIEDMLIELGLYKKITEKDLKKLMDSMKKGGEEVKKKSKKIKQKEEK